MDRSSTPLPPSLAHTQIVVALELHPKALMLLHMARRNAEAQRLPWHVIYVDAETMSLSANEEEQLRHLLESATRLGAKAQRVPGAEVPTLLRRVADEHGPILLMRKKNEGIAAGASPLTLAAEQHALWERALLHLRPATPFAPPLVADAEEISLSVVLPKTNRLWRYVHYAKPVHVMYSLILVLATAIFMQWAPVWASDDIVRVIRHNQAVVLLMCVAYAAGRYGILSGLAASVMGFLVMEYDSIFTYPLHVNPIVQHLGILAFLPAAALVSLFSGQTCNHAYETARRERDTRALFDLYRLTSSAMSREEALSALEGKLRGMLQTEVAFFLPTLLQTNKVELAFPAQVQLTPADEDALAACWRLMQPTGVITSPLSVEGGCWRFEPMIAPRGEIGVLGLRVTPKKRLTLASRQLIAEIAHQTAGVLEHIELGRTMEDSRLRDEREKLRSMLLSSVSHDLRTPLASIIGALNIYRSQGMRLTEEKRKILLDTASQEAERLDSFITNILDMTLLESGRMRFNPEWHSASHVIKQATRRMESRLRGHTFQIQEPALPIEIYMDMTTTAQALQNVVDNAIKYTQAGSVIELAYGADEAQGFFCRVRDHGAGIPTEEVTRIFDKYARLRKQDSQVAGTGLGLAISKAIMEAQNGALVVSNHAEGGAVFTFTLPQWRLREPAERLASFNAQGAKNA